MQMARQYCNSYAEWSAMARHLGFNSRWTLLPSYLAGSHLISFSFQVHAQGLTG